MTAAAEARDDVVDGDGCKSACWAHGRLDEIGIWNRALSASQ